MVGSESVHSSWADEAEKEAEEEAKAQLPQKPKPSPFGSARPREVILQERGIDWKKLDLHLQHSSPVRLVVNKENIPPAVPPLRYPPRNMVASLSKSGVLCNPRCSDVQRQGFQYKDSSTPEKQNAIHTNESMGNRKNFRDPTSHKNGSMEIQSMEKGRDIQKPAIRSYRRNKSGSLLGRPPVKEQAKQNIGASGLKTLQGW